MLVDILIFLIVIAGVYRNWSSGFLRQFWSSLGFFGGLLIGRWLEPHTVSLVHTPASRAIVTVVTILGIALILLTVGEYIGLRLKRHWITSKFNVVDNGFGSLLTVVSILLTIWLGAAVISSLPTSSVSMALQRSHITRGLNDVLPPAPQVIADIGHLIDPNGFPDVFLGSEPIPRGNVSLPSLGDLASVVNSDKNSVVRIQGLGCGGIVSGSGFVVANNLVATNAHVVAGIANPVVEDANGRHNAEVIWFDPNLDFAVLKVSDLAGSPLSLSTAVSSTGTPAAVLGYPGGGPFSAGSAAILDQFMASGHNIYGDGVTVRSIYEIQANVIPGNSGGPLVAEDGKVLGVVFAESTAYSHVGYALTTNKVAAEIHSAEGSQHSVNTGQCAE